jgi:hypothetical protein
VSGLGERGKRLRAVARKLAPAPAIPPFYVEAPDEEEIRAIGWYMRRSRSGPPIFLGHSASAAEAWLQRELAGQKDRRGKRGKGKSNAQAQARNARAHGA